MIRSDHLEAFGVFAEHLNFTRAAEALHLSQPALHAQIKLLTEALGLPLYFRDGRSLRLTAQGERLAAFARAQGRVHAGLLAELRGERLDQPLTLAAGEGAFLYLLGPAVQAFRQRSPAPLTLRTLHREACLAALRAGEVQVAVTVLGRRPSDLESLLIAEVPAALALPADHPLALRERLRLEDLAHERLVAPPPGSPTRALLDQLLGGQPWTLAVEARGWPLTLKFVAMGLGIAVVNGCVEPPDGAVLRPLDGFPSARYTALRRPGLRRPGGDGGSAEALWRALGELRGPPAAPSEEPAIRQRRQTSSR